MFKIKERSPISQRFSLGRPLRCLSVVLTTVPLLFATACTTTDTTQYEATALTTYTWQVDYTTTVGGGDDRPPRIEEFESTSLLNRNGQPPDGAVTGPDDQGLWWAELPPRPSLEEMEAQKQASERFGTPRLNKSVDYSLTFDKAGETVTLPTNYSVYSQIARLYPDQPPLELTLGVEESSVEKAEPK
ncbi:MAG: hypothetical protein SFY66_18860 [Oculatellaceae cyanobacterium bins.114]|nr:hypothetical protein [Oculatellaceae cyanobacterium bins.114]